MVARGQYQRGPLSDVSQWELICKQNPNLDSSFINVSCRTLHQVNLMAAVNNLSIGGALCSMLEGKKHMNFVSKQVGINAPELALISQSFLKDSGMEYS